MLRKLLAPLVAFLAATMAMFSGPAFAVDSEAVTAAKAAITTAQTDVTGALLAMLALIAVIWGIYKIIAIFGRK